MSVFTLDYSSGNPVTTELLDGLASSIGVTIAPEEKDDYHRLLAVYHDSAVKLMEMDGELIESDSFIRTVWLLIVFRLHPISRPGEIS